MTLKQIDPPMNVITPLGKALAVFMETDTWDVTWCTFQKSTGECWWWANHLIRLEDNLTANRPTHSPIVLSEEMNKRLEPHKARHK